mmetsp:Transcript_117966/g.334545  ORF Transcript_117966/g.334545 Transcript_117966/m.334545 type:complete len:385 (+) Transcript_117966:221-1375(+)
MSSSRFVRVTPSCFTCSRSSFWLERVWRSLFTVSMMSLAFASPFILRIPFVNSLMVRSWSPSSRTYQTSFSSLSFRPRRSIICLTFLFRRALKNSVSVSSPEPSLSISRKRSASSFSSRFFTVSASFAWCAASSIAMEKAFSTMTAVMRFQKTNTATMMKKTKKTASQPCFLITGRTTVSQYTSSVISWNIVNMDFTRSPKRSCMCSSSLKSLCLPINSVAATAKMYSITIEMSHVQTRGRAEVITPWISIQSSLKVGWSRTARAMRASLSVRSTVNIRSTWMSKPSGSSNHFTRTPVPNTIRVSQKFANSKSHTHPNATIRSAHSLTKNTTKKCSMKLKKKAGSPSCVDASQPIRMEFRTMTHATSISNCMCVTMLLISGCGF